MKNILVVAAAFAAGSAFAHSNHGHDAPAKPTAATATAAAGATSEAEVRKVDMDARKITLKHGEIKNLEMPPMTMVFQVKDPAVLGKVRQGDKVRFTAEKVNGAYTVMSIEPVK